MSYCPSEVDERVVAPSRPQSLSFVRIHHPPHTQYIQPKIHIEIKCPTIMGPSQHSVRNGFEREGTLREMHTLELKKVIQKCGTKIAKRNI